MTFGKFAICSQCEIGLTLVYKSFVEIAGHSGKYVNGSSFPLCIYLPRLFGIELYTCDHHLHHATYFCNYSKRFKLWDRVFGTFKQKLMFKNP